MSKKLILPHDGKWNTLSTGDRIDEETRVADEQRFKNRQRDDAFTP